MALADSFRHPCREPRGGRVPDAGRDRRRSGRSVFRPGAGLRPLPQRERIGRPSRSAVARSAAGASERTGLSLLPHLPGARVRRATKTRPGSSSAASRRLAPTGGLRPSRILAACTAAHPPSPAGRATATTRRCGASTAAFGRLLDGLQREGRLSRTAILLTSDHGEALCDRLVGGACLAVGHGTPYLFEEELLVPFEIRVPWMPKAQGVIRGNASELDVAPTLLDAAGVRAPAAFEGRSLLASPPPVGRPIVSEAPPLEALAVRIDEHKLIRRTGVPQKFWTAGGDFVVFPVQQSFDLSRDPGERTPLPSASDWGRELLGEVDRYLASGFPDALIVRFPRAPDAGGPPDRRLGASAAARPRPSEASGSPGGASCRSTAREPRFASGGRAHPSGSPSSPMSPAPSRCESMGPGRWRRRRAVVSNRDRTRGTGWAGRHGSGCRPGPRS